MSAPLDPLRDAVVRRAGTCCEYCQSPAQFQVGGFEVDHLLQQTSRQARSAWESAVPGLPS
jgi:hypothetical protein